MLRVTLKGLWSHRLRYALTGLAIVLGVAFMTGTMVLTGTMHHTFDGVFASANKGTDLVVRSDSAVKDQYSVVRDRVDAAVVSRVAAVDGVRSARGGVESVIQLVKADGTPTKTEGLEVTVGANWIDDPRLNAYAMASGRAPAADGEAVVDKRTAEREGWSLGQQIKVLTKAGPATLTVVGTARYGTLDSRPGSSLVATNDATAQRLFAEPGRYDSVLVSASDGVSAKTLQDRISAEVATAGSGLEIVTGHQATVDQQAGIEQQIRFIDQFLMAFAFVALFVGMFIIYNTFSIVVTQRAKELAVLRALGAGRMQVLRSIILESAVVGTLFAAFGIALGIGLSFGMRALIEANGLKVPSGGLVVSGSTVAISFVVGVVVSVLSAIVPAARAGRTPPIAALRELAVESRRSSRRRMVLGVLLTGAGVASFALGVSASDSGALPQIGLGALAVILGVCLLGPMLVRTFTRALGIPLRTIGVTGKYAQQNASRNPRRTSATASALMVGLALIGFITVLAASSKASVADFIDKSFRADYVVDSGSMQGFASSVENEVRAVPGVAVVGGERVAPAHVAGKAMPVIGLDTAAIDRLYDLGVTDGSIASVRGDGVAVARTRAQADGVHVGDRVPFRFVDGQSMTMTVRAVFNGNSVGGDGDWIVGLDTFKAHVADQFDRRLFVKFDPGIAPSVSRTRLDTALQDWPNATVQDGAEFKAAITSKIDALLNLVYGLLALTLVIALLGIANTLALSVHERKREIGLLRAIGMQRRQVRRAVRWESVLIALLGTVLGIALGIGGAWGMGKALADQGVTRFVVPTAQLLLIVMLAGLAGVGAAAGPARRASRLDVLGAITGE